METLTNSWFSNQGQYCSFWAQLIIIWGAAANNRSYSRKYLVFSTKPRRFATERVSEAVRTIPDILLYVSWLRKKPENKKCKILDKRCFNVQRHHPNRQISPTRPENVPKYKGFCIDFRSSRRHSMTIWCLCTLKHRLSRILHFLFSVFFLSRAMICVMLKITFPGFQTQWWQ